MTWEDPQILAYGGHGSPSIAASSPETKKIYVVYESYGAPNNLDYKLSEGAQGCGAAFPYGFDPLVDNPVNPGQPDVAIHSLYGNLHTSAHVVWTENARDLWYDRLDPVDRADVLLYSAVGSFVFAPQVAANETNLVGVIWQDTGGWINFMRSTNNGQTWGAPTRLAGSSPTLLESSIAIHEDVIHAVWADWRDGDTDILYSRSNDGGFTWGPPTFVVDGPSRSSEGVRPESCTWRALSSVDLIL
jgi:hypothetical protein